MNPYTMLAAAAMALVSGNVMSYEIIGSHYHVEVEPNKFIDQLVLRCEDGHEITVPWQSKLADACGEDLMGNVTRTRPKTGATHAGQQQKPATPKQPQSHNDNPPEQDVAVTSGATEPTTHFTPAMADILKKYEVCRRTHKDKSFCASERDRAMASLPDAKPADPTAPSPAQTPAKEPASAPAKEASAAAGSADATRQPRTEPATRAPAASQPAAPPAPPVASGQPAAGEKQLAAPPVTSEQPMPAAAATPPSGGAPTPDATPAPTQSEAERRAAAEKKISDDYAACMRNRPKLECEKARAKALADLERGKPAKPPHPQKRASTDAGAHPLAAQ